MPKKQLTIVLCSMGERGNAYIYVHRREASTGRRTKIKFIPLSMIRGDTDHIDRAIRKFVYSYGVEDFDVFPTSSDTVYLVQINRGYPRRDGDIFNLREYNKALEGFHTNESFPGGCDDIEAVRDAIRALLEQSASEKADDQRELAEAV